MRHVVLLASGYRDRSKLRGALEQAGFEVDEAHSAMEALDVELVAELVLTDVRLDWGAGLQFARMLKRVHPNARAIYLGAFVDALSWPLRTYVVGDETPPDVVVRMAARLLQVPRPNSELSST
ncbi:MAG TPA: response regulator [Gaiellaceae bacterium]|jgi:DNA-binding NtrC family response regulator|nr:response regulator [Gaiellaceae bacterium]